MKRISVFCLLILLLLSTCLAACGSTPAATTPAATTPSATPAATTPAATTPAVTTPTVNTKEKPVVTVDADGNVRWEPIYGATEYVVRVYNTYEGQTTRVHTYTVEEPSYRIFARDSITVTPKFDTVTGGACDSVSYMPAELYSFDLVSALANATRTETLSGGDTVYTIALPDGKTARLVLSGATLEADGTLTLTPNGRVYTLDHVGSIQSAVQTDTAGGPSPDVLFRSGYSFDKKSSVESYDELSFMNVITTIDSHVQLGPRESGYFDLSNSSYSNSFRLGALRIEYVPADPVGVSSVTPDLAHFPTLFDGAPTNYDRLEWNPLQQIYDFYLYATPDAYFFEQAPDRNGIEASDKCTVVGLKDGEGNEIPLGTPLKEGFVLTVAIGNSTFDVPLPMIEAMEIKADRIGDMNPYFRVETEGELNVIVVPLSWSDLPDRKNDTSISYIRRALGTVRESDGRLTSYESADGYSLSEYYREVSYGKMTTVSFVTDWYDMGVDFAAVRDTAPGASLLESVNLWLDENYDLDPAIYDRDGNGLYDAVIFMNTGDMAGYEGYVMSSYAGAFCGHDAVYLVPERAEDPVAYRYVTMPLGMLFDSQVIGTGNFTANTLIHEFGHVLGLVDYYCTDGFSISALGALDMMDKNVGDFNPYSKYALGWIEPEIVSEEDFGGESSVTFTFSSYEKTGNCLVIPARGYAANGTPFDEYVTVELLTFEGVNAEATETLSLSGTPGIRILHVDARPVEQHEYAILGSAHTVLKTVADNSYSSLGKIYGFYLAEVIQAGGRNTLTDPNQIAFSISDADLFRAGDAFDPSKYTEFFYSGLMDNSMEFGYVITVDSITMVDGEYRATVTVTKK